MSEDVNRALNVPTIFRAPNTIREEVSLEDSDALRERYEKIFGVMETPGRVPSVLAVSPQHMSREEGWGTPPQVVELVHEFFRGPPDLDPASSAWANEYIQAASYLGKNEDALVAQWPDVQSVWLNPPGGKVGNKSKAALFWARLMDMREQARFGHAIFLAFNLELLRTAQGYHKVSPLNFTFCVPRKRLAFRDPQTNEIGKSPSHANAIIYVPGLLNRGQRFEEVFSKLGAVR